MNFIGLVLFKVRTSITTNNVFNVMMTLLNLQIDKFLLFSQKENMRIAVNTRLLIHGKLEGIGWLPTDL
jgi:hypothetical protein